MLEILLIGSALPICNFVAQSWSTVDKFQSSRVFLGFGICIMIVQFSIITALTVSQILPLRFVKKLGFLIFSRLLILRICKVITAHLNDDMYYLVVATT